MNHSSFHKEITKPLIENIKQFHDRKAFCINDIFYTYQEFGTAIASIQKQLIRLDENDKLIGLVANDDLETYASIFALWFLGKAYIPLHPAHPIGRNTEIIEQVEITHILDSNKKSIDNDSIIIKTSGFDRKTTLTPEVIGNISDEETAYILFTSGSTGKPKGVEITRGNLGAFMDAFWASGIKITEEDRCSQCYDLSFDASVNSYLQALVKGACLYTISYKEIKFSAFFELIDKHNITVSVISPSMIRYLEPYFDEIKSIDMRNCLLVGEASPIDLIEKWKNCIPNSEIYNYYGPTEGTVFCSYYKLPFDSFNKSENGLVAIGKLMKDISAILIDDKGSLSNNNKGELCIAGNQLSKGYWKSPSKNKDSFFSKKINGEPQRYYRTGDICSKDEDGDYFCYGRLDFQVKIQGYRVELSEIEFHVSTFLNGENCVVIPHNVNGIQILVLFIESNKQDENKILEYLKANLPTYMIPSTIIFQEKLPLNSNAKIDRNKLKESIS